MKAGFDQVNERFERLYRAKAQAGALEGLDQFLVAYRGVDRVRDWISAWATGGDATLRT